MKKMLTIIVACCLLSGSLLAQSDSANTVSVIGSATKELKADKIAWFLTIKFNEKSQEKIIKQTDAILTQIKATALRLEIDPNDIDWGEAKISKRYKIKKHQETNQFSHFEFFQNIKLTQNDLKSLETFQKELIALEGVQVSRKYIAPEFESDPEQMLLEAVRDAEQKAKTYAAGLNRTLGDAISVSEFYPNKSPMNHNSMLPNSTTSDQETFRITIRIWVIFELK